MSVSVHDLHRLTAAAVEYHLALHAHHQHVAHGVAAQRRNAAAVGLKPDGTPLSGKPAAVEGPSPVESSRG